jgi:nucleoside-diphosphate-sugar epimerase
MKAYGHPDRDFIINEDTGILVTGAAGFIGPRLVNTLLARGFKKVRCLVRETSNLTRLREAIENNKGQSRVELFKGSLLSKDDCLNMTRDISVVYHLAAGTGTKSFADAFLNSVVTTRNLIDATLVHSHLKRFVNVSSFAVYTNRGKKKWRLLDETCPVERHPESRAEAYCYGKVKQDELVLEYGRDRGLPYAIMRPGTVYGPGKCFIPGRVGIDTFGIFLHLGGPNHIPLTYVDNCADAIALAGLVKDVNGEVFNIVDDDLPSSRLFLRLYKRRAKRFKSFYVPHALSWLFCLAWEHFSKWSRGQVPAVFTLREWAAYWKKTEYSNRKSKEKLGWSPKVSTEQGLENFFEACR